MNYQNICKTHGNQDKKLLFRAKKLQETYRTLKTKKIRWTRGREATPAGCGWT